MGMEIYESGSAVTIAVPVSVPSVQSAFYKVYDERRVVLVDLTVVTIPSEATALQIVVPQSVNTLAPGRSRMVVSVELTITSTDNAIKRSRASYLVQGDLSLKTPIESFVTFDEATLVASDLVDMEGWDQANDPYRRAALVQAAASIDRLNFDLDGAATFSDFPGLERFEISCLSALTQQQFDALPGSFLTALKRAQLLEANDILRPKNSPEKLREEGVVVNTVGESSQMFRSDKVVRGVVCSRAMRILSRYVTSAQRIARA